MNRFEVKACKACKASKRKCTKQQPKCRRCDLRGFHCIYESLPSMVFYRATEDTNDYPSLPEFQPESLDLQGFEDHGSLDLVDAQLDIRGTHPDTPTSFSMDDLKSAWFLDPNSWTAVPIEPLNRAHLTTDMICALLYRTKGWFSDWIKSGSNMFIHPELYRDSLPECIGDAFTTLSAYLSKTEGNADMVFRIMEQKADKLVASESTRERKRSTLDSISRVQALLAYCIIRLMDGDLRQRHRAEQHLQALQDWTKEMILDASNTTSDGSLIMDNHLTGRSAQYSTVPLIPCRYSPEQLLWHAWILSESVRRTWCVSGGLLSGYELLKTESGPCHGTIPITTRKGLWEAKSAFVWTKMCAESNIGFMCRNDHEKMTAEMSADEVDPFALCIMELDIGPDRMARWKSGHGA
ncbi:hypothetical protein FSARC_3274 [Fusarium sarcochroum]|uniref:Zn(2)-C6 fungal-type domain-containing protein n=1 Tax=Fusarium sarcochroum TaxID=1208366 RepID=A0A8H4U4T9_9HYPO|nr:hypothetical protein FSARC_3274 [Fusarium sarcochroum]